MFDYRVLTDEEFLELVDNTQKKLIKQLEIDSNISQLFIWLNKLATMKKQFYNYQVGK